MVTKKKRIYAALVDGSTEGLSDLALFAYIRQKVPDASSKNIVRASLLALSDPDLKDANILNTIYALAIKHRIDSRTAEELQAYEARQVDTPFSDDIDAARTVRKSKAKTN